MLTSEQAANIAKREEPDFSSDQLKDIEDRIRKASSNRKTATNFPLITESNISKLKELGYKVEESGKWNNQTNYYIQW